MDSGGPIGTTNGGHSESQTMSSAASGQHAGLDEDINSPSSRNGLIVQLATPPKSMRTLQGPVTASASAEGNPPTELGHANGDRSESPRPAPTKLTAAEQQSVLRRVTWRLLPYISLLYCLCFLDRANIANGHGSLLQDLQISEEQYAGAVAVFFAGYCVFEVPSNLLMKRIPANIWIARIMILWVPFPSPFPCLVIALLLTCIVFLAPLQGVCSCCMAAVRNLPGLMVTRFFLGAMEAGFFPGMVYYLSRWYTAEEIASKIAYFFSSSAVAGCLGGLLAYGLLQLDGSSGLKGWQILFLAEGLPSVIVGLSVFKLLPSSPMDASVTWLTADEKEWLVSRLPQPTHHHIAWSDIRRTVTNGDVHVFCVIYFATITVLYSISFFMPAILGSFGYSVLTSNLLSAPVYGIALIITVAIAMRSDRDGDRFRWIIWPSGVCSLSFAMQGIAMGVGNVGFQYFSLILNTSLSWGVVSTLR